MGACWPLGLSGCAVGDLFPALAGKVTRCGICSSWDLVRLLDLGRQPLAERYGSSETYPLALLECQVCTLVQLSYIVDQREVFPVDHPYASGNTAALRHHFAALAASLSQTLEPEDLVVDIGANDGTLLSCFGDRVRRIGVEPTNQASKCRQKGILTHQGFFTPGTAKAIRDAHGPAKVITACNVLAHVPDPHAFMAGVRQMLADDGVFVTENHDVASVLDGLQVDTVYHEHLRYYSLTSLSRLLGMYGLVVTGVQKIPTHGGSFRVTARRPRRDLAARAALAVSELRRLMADAAGSGPVYGIGATTRATPLIHFAHIAEFLACVCEVPGSEKIGQTMPGTDIAVVDEAKLIADQPPHALLLSWHLADSIIPALRAKGYEGKFILPLPSPVVTNG